MSNNHILQRVSGEIMRFMRGKYALDEIGNGKDELKFRRGGKTILTVYIRENQFDFLVIFGKAEQERFEAEKKKFPKKIKEIYDNSKTYHDGKWMTIPVSDMKTLEAVKELVLIKKKPNRKPFPKEQAIFADCGHRCDLCVHYTGNTFSDEFRMEIDNRINRAYEISNLDITDSKQKLLERRPPCNGCQKGGIGSNFDCIQRKCASKNGVKKCLHCAKYPCDKALVGLPPEIHTRTILAGDVTWGILPFVHEQYGN